MFIVSFLLKKDIMKKIASFLFILIFTSQLLYSQNNEFPSHSIKAGIGLAMNDGHWETGMGVLYSIGYQKSFFESKRLRLNPNIHFGSFQPYFITDTRDQLYKITSLELNINVDAIKYKAVSLLIFGGGFVNYSRGLLGTGGFPEAGNNRSEYFKKIYYGGTFGAGIRVNPKNSKFAYGFKPFNFHLGNNYFMLGYMEFGIEYKFQIKK